MAHQIVTQDYPENALGGVLLCGINFGFSKQDEKIAEAGRNAEAEHKSFFSDLAVCDYPFRNRLLKWLNNWGLGLKTAAGEETILEKKFFRTNWLDTQSRNIQVTAEYDIRITTKLLIENAEPILSLIEQRKPKVLIFVGKMLVDVVNNPMIKSQFEQMFGKCENGLVLHKNEEKLGSRYKFKVYTQRFGTTEVLFLPHTATIGLTDAYMAKFKNVIYDHINHLFY